MRFWILLKRVTTVALFALAHQPVPVRLYVEFLPGNCSRGSHRFQLFERSGLGSTAIDLLISKSQNQMHEIIYYPDEEFYERRVSLRNNNNSSSGGTISNKSRVVFDISNPQQYTRKGANNANRLVS